MPSTLPVSAPQQGSGKGTEKSSQSSQQSRSQKISRELSQQSSQHSSQQPSQQPSKQSPQQSQPQRTPLLGSSNHSQPDHPWSVRRLRVDAPCQLPQGLPTSDQPIATSMTGPPLPRYGHSVPPISTPSGAILVFGGLVKDEVKNDLWMIRGVWGPGASVGRGDRRSTREMRVVANLVETTGDAPGPRVGHKSALVGSMLVVWGGDTLAKEGERNDDGLYCLNLITHDWTKVGIVRPAPLGRYGHAVGMCGNRFVIFGGQVDGKFFNDIWSFDLEHLARGVSAWEQLVPAPGNEPPPCRTGHVLVTYNNKIYIFGGTDGASYYNDTWCFDVSTRTWSKLTCIGPVPVPREGHAAVLVGDIMYVFGGRGSDGEDLDDIGSFQISDQRWYMSQNMGPQPSGRSGHAMAVVDGRIFVIGGESGGLPLTGYDVMMIHVLDTNLISYPEDKPHQREKSNGAINPAPQRPPRPRLGLTPGGEHQPNSSPEVQEGAKKQGSAVTRKDDEEIGRKEHKKAQAQEAHREGNGKLQGRAQEAQRQEDPYQIPEEKSQWSPWTSDEESAYESAPEDQSVFDARESKNAAPGITTLGLSEMTAPQMLQCLVDYGCIDLTSAINPERTSPGMIVGGSFGDIWSGQLHNNTSIAIKVWRFTSLIEDRGKSLKRAMREICYWSELDHPHIHKLLGVTVFQGRLGMVSEWMPNGNLREYIQRNPSTRRHPLCAQVASGVEYLHRRGTVHGDIKAVRDGVIKLTDFDHSIMIDCSIRFTETSRVGGGTLRWMAPELVIIEPTHQRNKRTDVYALGMTLLEVITGRVPYELECQSDTTVVMKLLNKVMPRRTEHFKANRWGNGMWNLLVRCWDHDPNIRPSAEDVNVLVLDLSPLV